MRPLIIVKVYGMGYRILNFFYTGKQFVLQQLIFDGVINPFCLRIILWISRFCHTYAYMIVFKQLHVFRTNILTTPVRVMYQINDSLPFNTFQSHLESLYRISCFQGGAYAPSNNLFTKGIKNKGQITEHIMTFIYPYCYVCDITNP